jgi:hypothetical protein
LGFESSRANLRPLTGQLNAMKLIREEPDQIGSISGTEKLGEREFGKQVNGVRTTIWKSTMAAIPE